MNKSSYSVLVKRLPVIKDLSKNELEIYKDELKSHFMKYGNIQSVFLNFDYGFINFEDENSRNKALAENGQMYKNQKIEVKIQKEKREKENISRKSELSNLDNLKITNNITSEKNSQEYIADLNSLLYYKNSNGEFIKLSTLLDKERNIRKRSKSKQNTERKEKRHKLSKRDTSITLSSRSLSRSRSRRRNRSRSRKRKSRKNK